MLIQKNWLELCKNLFLEMKYIYSVIIVMAYLTASCSLRKTADKTQVINNVSRISESDIFVIFPPFYFRAHLDIETEQNFLDSGYNVNLGKLPIETQLTPEDQKHCNSYFKRILSKKCKCIFPTIAPDIFERLRGDIKCLKNTIKTSSLIYYKVPDSTYSKLIKQSGTYYTISDITRISYGGSYSNEYILTRVFVIEKRTHLLVYDDYSIVDVRYSLLHIDLPNFRKAFKKIYSKIPD